MLKKTVVVQKSYSVFSNPEGLFRKLISAMLVWLMVMSSLPAYAADWHKAQWTTGWELVSSTPPSLPTRPTEAAPLSVTPPRQQHAIRKSTAPAQIASLRPYRFNPANPSAPFNLPLQTVTSLLQVSVGFADSTSASANFPEPWNEKNSSINFLGGGTVFRAGAIRLDNPTGTDITVDSATVDLGRPGPVFQLWTNVVVPAFGSAVLTQTQDGNFNTSASPILGCGQPLAANETRIPKITIAIGGTSTDYLDTAHVLDTGGFDSSCRGNQSLEWRPIGTAGIENPAGAVQLIAVDAPHAVGTQNAVTILVNDAVGQPLPNATVGLNVINGPNAGKTFSAITDTNGAAAVQYSSATQGTDLLQAAVGNLSGGVLQSQQVSSTWTSAAACPAPATPNAAATRMIYVGQSTAAFGNLVRLAALLTDGAGVPLGGKTVSFSFATQTLTATSDANGMATELVLLPVGDTAVTTSFAGDQAFQPVQLGTTVSVQRAPTLLRYTGNNLIGSIGQQTVTALLTDALGRNVIANRTVTFTLNGVSATGQTDANGVATATLNFAAAQSSGAAQLQIAFVGDVNYQPSTRTVPVQIYQTMPFVVWGGNTGGLKIGQRVNFWGSQWEAQVINGQYYASNPSFKGWAGSIAAIQQCQSNATPATLTAACWQVKPGQSFPPDIVLPAYIEVIVSTVIAKSGDTVFGNIACGAVVQVDHTPPYGAVPGQPGFGTITAVNGDCAGVFPKPAVIAASQQQPNPVLPGQQIAIGYNVSNQGATDATNAALNEAFDQVTPPIGSANLGTIAAGKNTTGNFQVTLPLLGARQQSESSVDYESRLAASDGKLFTSEGEISFSDIFNQIYAPVAISSFSQLALPRLAVGVSGATCIAPGTSIPYQVRVSNLGSATAEKITATLTQPDSSTAPLSVPDLVSGTSFAGTVAWKAPGIGPKDAAESTQAYLSRLQAFDGTVLPPAVISATWQDHLTNSYGPVEQPFASLTQRVPVISVLTPAAQSLLPNQKTQLAFTASNIGTGNAVQVTLTLKRPDGSQLVLPGFSLPGGQNATLNADFKAPAVAAKGAAENDADYIRRLLTANGAVLNLNAVAAWTDSAANNYGPTDNPFTLSEKLPVLQLTASTTPASVLPGQTATLNLAIQNAGSADAQNAAFKITNPDGSTSNPAPVAVAAGQSSTSTSAFATAPVAAKSASESDSAYLTRLQSLDNKTLSFKAILSWADAIANAYGPVSAQAQTVEQSPILNITLAAPATANSGDTITYTVTLTNVGHAAASQVSGIVVLPNNSQQPLTLSSATITPGASLQSTFTFATPATQPSGTISATVKATWADAVPNAYGPVSASTSTQLTQPNLPPVVSAGTDQTIPFPNFFPLQGTVTDDGKPAGGALVATWTQISGPAPAVFANPHDPKTTVTLNAGGVYVLKLTGDDSQLQASSQVTITTVRGNQPPAVTVGLDQTIELPVNTVNLTGSATDDGLPAGSSLTYSWTKVGGPGTVSITSPNSPNTAAVFSATGLYILRLSVSDSQITSSADVRITVLPHNNGPTVNAGPNQTILLPVTTVTLAGTATDDGFPAGGALSTLWSVVTGPGTATFGNASSLGTTATFSATGVYVLRLTATDSVFTVNSDVTITVKPANLPPLVNAGASQTIVLPSNVSTLPVAPTLVPISTGFNNPVGIDYHQPTNKVVMSVNYSGGQPYNFELVAADGSRTQFSNIRGLTDEVYIAAARNEVNGHSIGGFVAGEMFTGSGVGGVIVRISPDGNTVQNPWVTLPGESGLLRGQLYIDRTGVFGGDLIIATTTGNIWRVTSSGVARKLANVGVPPEGLITIPNDPAHYGPWAGKILTGSENSGRLFAIDPDNTVTFFDFGIFAEHIKLVNANENFFGVDFGSSRLLGIPASELAGMVGDIIIGEESPGTLWQLHWNGTRFEGTKFAQVSQWEGATMAPAGIVQVASTTASVTLNGTISDDGLPAGGALTSLWSKVSGPGTVTFISTTTPVTTASFSQPGTYVLRLAATDSELTSSSDVTIIISANSAPVVQAGPSQEITLPATANLTGTVTDDGLPVNGKLSSFWTKVIGPGTVTFSTPSFDGTDNFSAASNPSGTWTYGSTPTRGGAFTPYAFTGQLVGMPSWFRTAPTGGPTFPLLAYNNTGVSVVSGGLNIPPLTLLLHPGPSGENSVLRFTAPADGSYLMQGRFYGVDNTTTDVSILLNSSTTLLTGSITTRNIGVPFTFVRALKAGDKIDFSVGFGNGSNNSDSTGLQVIVTQAGGTSSTASFSSPGDYILRLSGSDSELFSFSDAHVHVSTPCVPAPSGLVGWWPGDGDTRDLANANAGVVEDGVTFVPGMVGQAFGLNGGAADVVIPSSAALNVKSFTMDAWVFPLDVGGRPIMEFSNNTGIVGVHLWEGFDASVTLAPAAVYANIVDANGISHVMSTGGGALQYKRWNHVALTYDQTAGVARIFVNGTFVAAASLGVFTPRTNLPLYIGARPNATHFLGNIDEPQVFNRALSPSEILAIYTAGNAGNCKPTGPQPPVVSAGLDQTITLPTLQTTLNGTATDPNGGQLSIAWTVDSAAGPVTFGNPASATTTTTFVTAGVYVLRLTASNSQRTATSVVTVTVVAVPNKVPQVDAGPNQTIQLPVSSVTLNGKVTDDGLPLGSIVTQQWSKVAGPGAVTFSAPTQPVTQATFSSAGTYTLRLTATDSEFTVNASVTVTVLPAPQPNQGPAISVSVDSTVITLPANTITLTGTISDDGLPLGSTVTALWSQVSGPGTVSFLNPASASTRATFSAAGSYQIRLTASDSQLSTSVTIPITVNPPAPNQAPLVTVAASQTSIALPNNVVSLTGRVTDDGLPVGGSISLLWSQVSGPAPVTFGNPTAGSTQVSFSVAGTYVLQLAASDSQLTGSASISITVNPAGTNQAPVVAIMADRTVITLPVNTVVLTGTVNDDGLPSGSITTQWSQVSGPVAATIAQATPTSVSVTFTTAGVYVFKLTASDGQLSASSTITITVTTAGGNQPPTVRAGVNQTIQLPRNTAALTGFATDDGLPTGSTLTSTWSQISGPAPVAFSNAGALVTQATFSAAGVYAVQLLATDGQLQSTSQITITVTTAPVPPPPPPVVSFTGFADGAEITTPTAIIGSVSSGSWKLEYSLLDGSGNPTTFVPFASGTTAVNNGTLGTFDPTVLLNGQYLVRFTSTDTAGQTATATSTVDVSRNQKVGNFTLAFNDLSVPMPGLPITVVRTYDSRDKRVGDFGVGWTLSVNNIRVQKTGGAIGKGWDEEVQWSGFFPTYCLQPVKNHFVSVTFPDGRVYKFQAVNTPQCQQIVPITVPQIGFTQISTGANTAGATLTPVGDPDLLLDGSIPGPTDFIDFNLDFADYTQFKLVTAEGFTYNLDQKLGATSVTDPNGNTVTINANGVIHSGGKSVAFVRDILNRITQITDTAGNALHYSYNGAGDLVSFTDRAANTTTYAYDTNHLLTDIIDPRGVQVAKTVYDDTGRIISSTDANGNTINFAYPVGTNEEIVTDRLGNPTIYKYDDDGNIVQETDALGNVTTSTFDANDNKLTETNALGQTTTFAYDSAGNKTSETDALGHASRYVYNSRKQVVGLLDSAGHSTNFNYDSNGNLLSTKDPSGNSTTYTYNAQGLPLTVTDNLNNVTTLQFDANSNLIKQVDALGNATSFTYDGSGNRISQSVVRTRSDGTKETLTTSYAYDGNNRLVKTTLPDGSSTQVAYNPLGKQSETTDALGRKTLFGYDANGRLIKTTYPDGTNETSTYDANDRMLTHTDKSGRTTTFIYDPVGRLTKTTLPDGSTTQTAYDAIGQPIKTIDALGNLTQYGYDNGGHRTSITDAQGNLTHLTYDAVGNQISVTDALNHTTQYVYDNLRHQIQVVYPDGTKSSVGYDSRGRQSSRTDQAGKTTQLVYDALSRLTSLTDAAGQVTRYVYDELGNRTGQTDANNHTTSFAYDQVGHRVQVKLPTGQTESFAYDAARNMTTKTDFNGHKTTYVYDTMNRLTLKTADPFFLQNGLGASTVGFTYTPAGRRATMTDGAGVTSYAYDGLDRVTSKATPFGSLSYTYDAAGNMLSVKSDHPNGASTTYSYDLLNRLASATDATGATAYSYDAAGNLAGTLYPNTTGASYHYDALNRLTNIQTTCSTAGAHCSVPGTAIAGYTYTLGPAGNRLSVQELGGRSVQYVYDNLYRLTSETITGAVSQNGTISYQYDPVGNRLQLTSTVAAIPSGLMNYDANDRLTSETYDANGNTIDSGGIGRAYDFEDHLVRQGNATIVYDGDGNRVSKTAGGLTTTYLVDTNNPTGFAQVLEELQGGAVVRTYSYGLELINQRQIVNGALTTSFYGYDGHGSVRFLTDASGTITDTYDYDAFGNLIRQTGTTPNNYLYSGEQYDPDLGLYYNRARYLNTNLGRFITGDPLLGNLDDPLSLHRYLYARLDPVNRSDPSGQQFTMGEISITLSTESTLEALEVNYYKQLFQFTIAAARCIFCLINPGYEKEAAGMGLLFDDLTAEAGLREFQDGESMILEGYRDMGKAIINMYMDTAIDAGLSALSHQIHTTIDFVKLEIGRLTISVAVVQTSSRARIAKAIEKLKKLVDLGEKSNELVDEYRKHGTDEKCKLAFGAVELLVSLIL